MSEKSLIKTEASLKKQIGECVKNKSDEVFTVISDSKGRYLERASFTVGNIIPNSTRWWCRSGCKSGDTLDWVKNRFSQPGELDGGHVIFLWIGTCDLTVKGRDGLIKINDNGSAAEQLIENYKNLVQFLRSQGCKVIVLELPYYSIKIWNSKKTKSNTDTYTEEDKILRTQIDHVNEQILKLNDENLVRTPILNKDLVKYRSGGKNRKTSHYINWAHLPDGIHPAPLISRIWLLKLILCYHKI